MSETRVRVAKFGGTIIGSGPRLALAAGMLARESSTITIAVASAPGSLTNELLAITDSSRVAADPHHEADVLAAGEVLGATLLASALRSRGRTVHLVLPADPGWPIRLAGTPRDASVDLHETRERFQKMVHRAAPGDVFVLPGFVGVDAGGHVGTMPRGGGDTTAVVAARALDLDEVVLVKDVPGVLDADPRIVPEARPLAELTVAELALLAEGGSRIVARDALRYVAPEMSIRVVGLEDGVTNGSGTVVRPGHRGSIGARVHPGGAAGRPWALVTALARHPEGDGATETTGTAIPTRDPSRPLPGPSGWLWVTPLDSAPELVREIREVADVRAVTYRELVGATTGPAEAPPRGRGPSPQEASPGP